MVTKNKCLNKKEKYAQGQFSEAHRRVSELEEQLRAEPIENQPPFASITQDEVHHLETSLAKAQKAVEIAKTEVGRLRDELRKSSYWETGVRAQVRKALKDVPDKL